MEQQSIIEISSGNLLAETAKMKSEGWRLVAITCSAKQGIELSYSFDKDYELASLRFSLEEGEEIESIGSFYSYSFLYENEIKELFGVKINHIPIDFEDKLYVISEKTPFRAAKEEV